MYVHKQRRWQRRRAEVCRHGPVNRVLRDRTASIVCIKLRSLRFDAMPNVDSCLTQIFDISVHASSTYSLDDRDRKIPTVKSLGLEFVFVFLTARKSVRVILFLCLDVMPSA